MKPDVGSSSPVFLGIEGGGTHTVALLADNAGKLLRRVEAGPANLRLLKEAQLIGLFRELAREFPSPAAVGIGMAGMRDREDRRRVLDAAGQVWRGVPCEAAHDLETALLAAGTSKSRNVAARVIVLSGTGSCCYGRASNGATAKLGGWGHILGDKGSAYEIGLRALKAAVYYYDRDGVWSALGQRILRSLQLNVPDDLIGWVQTAGKPEVAALAQEVFAAAGERDKIASDILEGAAHSLAKDGVSCAKRLVKEGETVEFVLAGGVLLKQERFARRVASILREVWLQAAVVKLQRESAWGAIELAKQAWARRETSPAAPPANPVNQEKSPLSAKELIARLDANLASSPTEQRNPRSLKLDRLPLKAAICLMIEEETYVQQGIDAERARIERAIRLVVRAFRAGGRLFYFGAGTSGRLGVLDASECPPTFRTPADLVQGIIAGGQQALWKAVEGAEDNAAAGADAAEFRGVGKNDVVIGIAASGRTPFVWGALLEARRRGAKTVLLCFNPALKIPREIRPDIVIAPNVGPEILTGSTRLKSGTATKLILNMITTLAMVQTGKVLSNLMVDLNASNVKLRARAVRLVQQLTGAGPDQAQEALEKSNWIVKEAAKKMASQSHGGHGERRRKKS